MQKISNYLDKYAWAAVLILVIPAVWALLAPGFYGASDDMHVAWLYEMDRVVKLGQIPPRYVPDLSFQFGYPLFNFVFPLPFYVGELFHLVGLSFVNSIKAVFLISVPLSALFMYLLLRKFVNPALSLLGATLYVFTPYRATDLYVRGAIGEIVSFVFLPLLCLSVTNLAASQVKKIGYLWIGVGGLALAGLILTHNITAYMFLPAIFVLGTIFLVFSKDRLGVLLQLSIMVLSGLLASVYFWLPAVLDSKLMKYDTIFSYFDHFPSFLQLVKPYWGYGSSVPGSYDGMSFFIGLANWLIFLIGLPLMIKFWKNYAIFEKVVLSWAYAVFIFAIFMMNYRSAFIWQAVPNLAYFQFPWRFLILTTFVSPLFLIALNRVKFPHFLIYALIILLVAVNAFQFRPQDFLGRDDQYYLNRYIPYPSASSEYREIKEEYLRLPKENRVRPDKVYSRFFSDKPFVANVLELNSLNAQAEITTAEPISVSYNKYFFPGWSASLDGRPITLRPGSPYGQISASIPAGTHRVKISFAETGFKLFLDILSAASLVALVLLLSLRIIKR